MRTRWKIFLTTVCFSLLAEGTAMAGTWEQVQDSWKYRNEDGSYAAFQWINDQGQWYFIEKDEKMKTGWLKDQDGQWYYLDPKTGAMVSDCTLIIDGKKYTFHSSGAWKPSSLKEGWNQNTYVNHRLGYRITIPDYFQAVTTAKQLQEDGKREEFTASAPDQSVNITVSEYQLPHWLSDGQPDLQLMVLMKLLYGIEAMPEKVTFHDCQFIKLTVGRSEGMTMEVYCRKTGTSLLLIETLYLDTDKRIMDEILGTIELPD
ncbi:MAG TPA: hypothetical protein H9740_00970 [Candidatus Hungatella pullicola]|nr:hypothetical protein [Candidatus Hungatella pullicola]